MSRMADHLALPAPPTSLTIALALSGSKKSKNVVLWAIEKFASQQGNVDFRLIHVHPKITSVPTPMGNAIPISEVRDDVAAAYRQEVKWQAMEMIKPFEKICERKKVAAEIVMLEADDVAAALAEEINRHLVNRLVIGGSSRSFFSRKIDLCSTISSTVPSFCTVYVVSKGKLSSVRPSDSEGNATIKDDGSERTDSSSSSSGHTSAQNNESLDVMANTLESNSRALSLPVKRLQSVPMIIRYPSVPMETSSVGSDETRSMSLDAEEIKDVSSLNRSSTDTSRTVNWTPRLKDFEERKDAMSSSSSNREFGNVASRSSWTSMVTDTHSRVSQQASNMSDVLSEHSYTDNQVHLNYEIEKLRAELRHVQEMYAMAQTETMDASRKLTELSQRRLEEAIRLEELKLKEQDAQELAEKEKQKYEQARREAGSVRERAEREAAQRREAERKAARDAKEKEKLESALGASDLQYQHFTWEEIAAATSSFSEDLKIGMGAYGTVYKCNLHHTTAAVKVLHSAENALSKQFQQELEILSKIRHPHLLLLLGACPEQGCLVYEYMENGSLEDRLFQVNNSPPIPWFERVRIAWEVASALVFLHKSKPKPIIHRDLKPANILLDHNFVSKVGDVGLSTMVQIDPLSTKFTVYKHTSPVGTLCYIDPEYQRTGMISSKSDVYSFGMIILQLLTAKPAIALTHVVERAMSNNNEFLGILDQKAGNWPIEETRELTALALCCTELRRKDRPDLKDQILPALEGLRKVADKARNSLSSVPTQPPSHFICPLLKDVMNEPCVAADGYTYDRRAIEEWLEQKDTSPMTNSPFPSKNLLPNYTLYTAIMEWRSRLK
ncbi:PREDICTED: U-box domain-containing protein 35 isoform X2 [Tarenaya hassleriana]|nr:PREDICTED: U-box domain-containing protein 35 isoform X2 [Tarenaya hassleriana]XP_010555607.1 PREDICTED: U-box domain-containing protein 35 isoform X2 [Tarenaya hassleriana]XP_010555608.1 PREDICTED: U-box domain-containing protein 35 isoform X2 [Tarenaya hassleriana]